jgi:lysine-specific demethylase 8
MAARQRVGWPVAEELAVHESIDQVQSIAADEFRTRYFRRKRPLHISGLAKSWPAMQRWDFAFFAEYAPTRPVYVESGNVLQGATDFAAVDLRAYLSWLRVPDAKNRSAPGTDPYLSLFDIFSHFPELQKDVDFSLLRNHTLWNKTFGWFGRAGSISGFHIDWIDNLLVQIRGRKRLWLVPPYHHHAMYPSRKYDYRSTLSSVDPAKYDRERFPLFERLRPIELLLEPGNGIYLPRGWWHRVEALEPSISINNFGHDLLGLLLFQSRTSVLDVLHKLGLFRRECTCHRIERGSRLAR